MMNKQQGGFTMIELIMVIVILGILAAFALPRFADMGGDARRATIEGVAGSMRSATAIVHSAWLAAGNVNADAVDVEGTPVTVDDFGYPTAAGIIAALDLSDGDFDTTTPGTVMLEGAPDEATCSATYTAATGSGTTLTAPPSVEVAIAGC